ncbi:hypothetical protein PGTUg99_017721 [Puccinia graminis f. sp. tritici]|uniref:Uncharacterized protein n=1 Tax=Puccinia graminis f. sp. tritici TaxID=56615 RepID=A0A5B0R501_PUCGR|nr:hypothetical protein PGTUg99_017721 [Puccinia graminis f. sp. tritici]
MPPIRGLSFHGSDHILPSSFLGRSLLGLTSWNPSELISSSEQLNNPNRQTKRNTSPSDRSRADNYSIITTQPQASTRATNKAKQTSQSNYKTNNTCIHP